MRERACQSLWIMVCRILNQSLWVMIIIQNESDGRIYIIKPGMDQFHFIRVVRIPCEPLRFHKPDTVGALLILLSPHHKILPFGCCGPLEAAIVHSSPKPNLGVEIPPEACSDVSLQHLRVEIPFIGLAVKLELVRQQVDDLHVGEEVGIGGRRR